METFTLKEVFKKSWENTKKNLWFLVSATFIYFVVSILINESNTEGAGSIILVIAGAVLSVLFNLGLYRIGLLIESGKTPKATDFKSEPKLFLNAFLLSFISGVIIFLGFLFLIIPGIFFMIRLFFSNYILIDKKLGAWDSIKESWRMTEGFGFKILGFLALSCLVFFLAVLPLGLGLLIAVPFFYIAGAILYRRIKNIKEVKSGENVSVV